VSSGRHAVPFDYLHHLVTVPVRIGAVDARFVLDTGMGLVLVTEQLAACVGLVPDGSTYTGRRMSGQEVTVPVARAESLSFGGLTRRDVPVGILDLDQPALAMVGGFLSLAFFRDRAVTFDYPRREIVVEDAASLEDRMRDGASVEVRVEQDELSAEVFLRLDVPGAGVVEVDTGSDVLILDESLASPAGVDLGAPGVRIVEATDETGHAYRRAFTTLSGSINPVGAPHIAQRDPPVMFQQIIYDGLVGDTFLRDFVVMYDLARSRMIFAH
jgi:predicted aspartyl protease